MINPQELKIGNWVEYALLGKRQIRTGADIDRVFDGGGMPIPLTPEILEACGFTHHPDFVYPDRSKAERWANGHFLVGRSYDGEGFGIEWIIGGGHSVCPAQLLYLHQLQNLFYTVSGGKELTYTPVKERVR